MNFQQNYFYLCKTPLSAESAGDVEIITKAEDSKDFSRVFVQYEELRSHAFNSDNIYSVVRADTIYELVRSPSDKDARKDAYEKATPEIITNLQHRVVQNNDAEAEAILKEVYGIEV